MSTVICLHSSGSSGRQWTKLRTMLEPDAHVLAPDFHGHADGPTVPHTAESVVAADTALVERLVAAAPGPVHLVGHSYGGAIALRVALERPDSVTSVTAYEPVVFRLLFEVFGTRSPAAEVIEVARRVRRRLRSNDAAGAAAGFVDYWSGAGAWQALSADQRGAVSSRIATIASHFIGLARDPSHLADYRWLRSPSLLLYGVAMRSPMRRLRELLRFALPNATFESMAGMGHMGPISHAEAVGRRIAAFIRQHTDAPVHVPQRLAA